MSGPYDLNASPLAGKGKPPTVPSPPTMYPWRDGMTDQEFRRQLVIHAPKEVPEWFDYTDEGPPEHQTVARATWLAQRAARWPWAHADAVMRAEKGGA
jgi:hypothetical protein